MRPCSSLATLVALIGSAGALVTGCGTCYALSGPNVTVPGTVSYVATMNGVPDGVSGVQPLTEVATDPGVACGDNTDYSETLTYSFGDACTLQTSVDVGYAFATGVYCQLPVQGGTATIWVQSAQGNALDGTTTISGPLTVWVGKAASGYATFTFHPTS